MEAETNKVEVEYSYEKYLESLEMDGESTTEEGTESDDDVNEFQQISTQDISDLLDLKWKENSAKRLFKYCGAVQGLERGKYEGYRSQLATTITFEDQSTGHHLQFHEMQEKNAVRLIILFLLGHPCDLYSEIPHTTTDNQEKMCRQFVVDFQNHVALSRLSLGGQSNLLMTFALIRNQIEEIKYWNQQSERIFPAFLALQAFSAGVNEELARINYVLLNLEKVYRQDVYCVYEEERITTASLLTLLKQVKKHVCPTISSILKLLGNMPLISPSSQISSNHLASNAIQDYLYSLAASDCLPDTTEIQKMKARLFAASIQPTFELMGDFFSSIHSSFDPTNEFFVSTGIEEFHDQNHQVSPKTLPRYLQSFGEKIKSACSSRTTIHATAPCAKTIPIQLKKELNSYQISLQIHQAEVDTHKLDDASTMENWLLKSSVAHRTRAKETCASKNDITEALDHNFEPFALTFERILHRILQPTFVHFELQMHEYLFENVKIDKFLNAFGSVCFFQSQISSLFTERIFALPRLDFWRLEKCLVESIEDEKIDNRSFSFRDFLSLVDKNPSSSIKNDVTVDPFALFELSFHAPWPVSQLLTVEVQSRYSAIFRLLASLSRSIKFLNLARKDLGLCQSRLYALNFVNSFASYAFHGVVIPQTSSIEWRSFNSIEEIMAAHIDMLESIEAKLFLTKPAITKCINEMLTKCGLGIYDQDLSSFLRSALLNIDTNLPFFF